jgi:hypothetical protein
MSHEKAQKGTKKNTCEAGAEIREREPSAVNRVRDGAQ